MKFVIQRVSRAKVTVEEETVGEIRQGFLVLIGVGKDDDFQVADKFIRKMLGLRIFEDADGKTNLSLKDVDGELLLISQFTLYADCKKGNRPSFMHAGEPGQARELYEYIVKECQKIVPVVQQGVFGAHMHVELENDGPFTILLDDAIL